MNNKIFYILTAGFTLGIFTSSYFKMGFSFFLLLLLLAIVIFLYALVFKKSAIITFVALFILSFGLGILRYEIKEIKSENTTLQKFLGEKVTVEGIIIEEPSVKDETVQLTITDATKTKILVSTSLFPKFEYGDLIKVEGKLETPKNFETDIGKDFDYINYLAREDIFYQISFAQAELISSGNGSFVKRKLFAFKNAFIDKINILIKEPESSLLNGLLLGAKNSLGKEWQADFRLAGVSHIVALSGYNITIVAMGIMALLVFLPKMFSLSFGVIGIMAFAIMTGGTATVMRASIMALLVLLAKGTNRKYEITRALLLAGVFMLIQNPKILVSDISFQLSFLATIALIYISPLVERRMTFITEKYELREIVVSTIATQIFVLPFLLYKMGLFSVFALPANVLILPIIPVIMFLGFLAGMIGFVSVALATPVAFVCSLLLSYMLKVINIFAHLPYSSLTINNFSANTSIVFYLIFGFILWRHYSFQQKDEK